MLLLFDKSINLKKTLLSAGWKAYIGKNIFENREAQGIDKPANTLGMTLSSKVISSRLVEKSPLKTVGKI